MSDYHTLAHFTEPEDFPHADVIDSRDLHGRTFGPEIDAELADAAGYAPDWEYGEALIADSYFTEYAQQLADDIGAINKDAGWPNSCIDWERAARELQQDYTAVDIDGSTYWVR